MITYTRFDGFVFRWNGLHTINVYTCNGANVDVFSVDYSRDDHKIEPIIAMCDEWEECFQRDRV
jgi:hypothetical protein